MHSSSLNTPPPLPPGKDKHHIVVLEGIHAEMPAFDFPHTITVHQRTTPSQVSERIKDATIVIACVVPVTAKEMDNAPHLGALAVMAVGIQWVDKEDCARRGVTVTKCPGGNVDAVSEHFLGLYFASRRRVVQVHNIVTTSSDWVDKGSLTKLWPYGPPMGAGQETLGIMGYGTLGKRIEQLAKAVGFREVLISERKNATTVRPGRVSFEDALRRSSVLGICLPKEQDTIDLIGDKELQMMQRDALVINVARGGIVNEAALAKALKEGWIAGAATDVLETEPGGAGTSPLMPNLKKGEEVVPNLTICKSLPRLSQSTPGLLVRLVRDANALDQLPTLPGSPSPQSKTTNACSRKALRDGWLVPCSLQRMR
jgi:phosphoglycerate dehydrogenase-like enzyme